MSNNKEEFATLDMSVQPAIKSILESIGSYQDLDSLILLKKIFKKHVPFHMRSYVSAFLLKEYLGGNTGNFSKKKKVTKKEGEKSIFINIGKNRRVYPSDLIQLISKTADISKESIGNIKILDNYSFVNIDEEQADIVVNQLNEKEYRGRKLTVNFAKKDI